MLTGIGSFFLDQWLWSVTWGWYHIPINTLLLIFLLNIWVGMRFWRACLISLLLNGMSFAIYTGLVVGILMYAAGMEYVMPSDGDVVSWPIWRPTLFLGIIFMLLQLLLIFIARSCYTPNSMMKLYGVIIMSNLLAAFFSYKFVLLTFI